jgi:hypothetical protein
MGSSRQLLDPGQKLEIPREGERIVVSSQLGGAAEATVAGLIDDEEDLHSSTVRFPKMGFPRRFP